MNFIYTENNQRLLQKDYFTLVKVVKGLYYRHLAIYLAKYIKRNKMAVLYQILTDVTLFDRGCEFHLFLRNKNSARFLIGMEALETAWNKIRRTYAMRVHSISIIL